jgi:hypothetical protein
MVVAGAELSEGQPAGNRDRRQNGVEGQAVLDVLLVFSYWPNKVLRGAPYPTLGSIEKGLSQLG